MRNRKRIIAVIQARMSSSRLPGKVLRIIKGKPLLDYLIERLWCCSQLDGIVLATSEEVSDDALFEFAKSKSVRCYRGSLDNVAQRILNAAYELQADAVVRVCGDSPLLDHCQIDRFISIFRKDDELELVTNVQQRTFPKGQSIEILSISALERLVASKLSQTQKEHVTEAIYLDPERFRILNIANDISLENVQLSVDTDEDMKRFESILNVLSEPYHQHSMSKVVDVVNRLDRGEMLSF